MDQSGIASDRHASLAIVGHTNTGKTSLLRTLLHDAGFGEVADAAGTTRQVAGARMRGDDGASISWYDTPGLEDSIALLEYIEQIRAQSPERMDGPDSIEAFLRSPESTRRFEQEARVLKQLLKCQAGLYVVDAREPMQPRHQDELEVLNRCGRPLIPVLNFLHASENHSESWRQSFARQGLHVVISFDSVAPALDGEEMLYKKLALVLEDHRDLFTEMARQTTRRRQERFGQACDLIAAVMMDFAGFRRQASEEEAESVWRSMQSQARESEKKLYQDLLSLYRFPTDLYKAETFMDSDRRLHTDLFSTEALKNMGIELGKGFAAGAIAGAGIDLITGGLSLGTGALLGGVAGSLWQGSDKWGRRILGKIQGHVDLTLDEPIIRAIGVKGLMLVKALEQRGHADRQGIAELKISEVDIASETLPSVLRKARSHPEWSQLNDNYRRDSERERGIKEISQYLQQTSREAVRSE